MKDILVYCLAALGEIGGCYAFWRWLREGAPAWIVAGGMVSLAVFAFLLTRIDSSAAGRAYAAYGGIYILFSFIWLFAVEGVRPTAYDVAGVVVSLAGTGIILFGAKAGR